MKDNVDVREATHVKLADGRYVRIKHKWGIKEGGRLAKPSEGGFGVITDENQEIDMWEAKGYGKEE